MTDQAFVAGVPLGQALQSVVREGFAFVPRALMETFRRDLHREIRAFPFEPVPEEIGPVRQETEECVIPAPMHGYPMLETLSQALVASVREHLKAILGLDTWQPTAAFVQRYRAGALGITPHLDGRRFRLLVAVFTTNGSARFSIHESRRGPATAGWAATPGSLVLLRGPGLAGVEDGRPFHSVGGPRDQERYSVSFRMDTRRG
jgi:alkylated DNA repair dioxygenase AlkB